MRTEVGDRVGADLEVWMRWIELPAPKLFEAGAQPLHTQAQTPLPSKERALHLINLALDFHILYHVIHRPTFDLGVHMLFLDARERGEQERRYLSLVYILMALGRLCEKQTDNTPNAREVMRIEA